MYHVSEWNSSCENNLESTTTKENSSYIYCFICNLDLVEPYICCAECSDVLLCTKCFSCGLERDSHENSHAYVIVRNDFNLFENSNWSAKQEATLLSLLQEHGFGNWYDISIRIKKSPKECERHYLRNYINRQSSPFLPNIQPSYTTESVIFPFVLKNIGNPPRFDEATINYQLTAGYNPARSEFGFNFDNHAEIAISQLDTQRFSKSDPCFDLHEKLQLSMLEMYNNRLRERHRRNTVIKNHGLISMRSSDVYYYRYNSVSTINKALSDRLKIFTRFCTGIEYDFLMQYFHKIGELKIKLHHYFRYRRNGLKNLHNVDIFERLLKLKTELPKRIEIKSVIPLTNRRKNVEPMTLHSGMEGYDKLSTNEVALCSRTRIDPQKYREIKKALVNESRKNGTLKLSQARSLLKIDVNKTKLIYEFLSNEGLIKTA